MNPQNSTQQKIHTSFLNILDNELLHSSNISYEKIISKLSLKTGIQDQHLKSLEFLEKTFNFIWNQSFLSPLLSSPFQNIIIHSHNHVQIDGRAYDFINIPKYYYQLALEALCHKNRVSWNTRVPFSSFHCYISNQQIRASLTHKSIHPSQTSKLYLRSLKGSVFPFENYGVPLETISLLKKMITNKHNILVCGATGSGKTSLVNSLINQIPEDEHTVILEDTHELTFNGKNLTHLIANENSTQNTLENYCKMSLRLSPQRIVLGEIRGNEIIPFTLAMNTGHRGVITTLHADSAVKALERMSLLFSLHARSPIYQEQIYKMMCKNIDNVIFLKDNRIYEIIAVKGSEKLQCYYQTLYKKSLS